MSPKIASAIACRDIHAAAQRDGKMGKVPAYAAPLDERLHGGPCRACMGIAEAQVIVHEIADRLNARPTGRRPAEIRPGEIHQALGLAITAGQKIHQRIVRQFADLMLAGGRIDLIGQTQIRHHRVGGNFNPPGRGGETAADVAERVQIAGDRHERRDLQLVRLEQITGARRMHIEHEQHRRALGELVGEFKANADFHMMYLGCFGREQRLQTAIRMAFSAQGPPRYRKTWHLASKFERGTCKYFRQLFFVRRAIPRDIVRIHSLFTEFPGKSAQILFPALQRQKSRPSSRMKRASTMLCTSDAPSTRRACRA